MKCFENELLYEQRCDGAHYFMRGFCIGWHTVKCESFFFRCESANETLRSLRLLSEDMKVRSAALQVSVLRNTRVHGGHVVAGVSQ